jgi:hypothetical protein
MWGTRLSHPDAMKAMRKMKKPDIAALEQATSQAK